MYPEITVAELAEKLKSNEEFILLDVRELSELNQAKITDARLEVVPMSLLARDGLKALSESVPCRKSLFISCAIMARAARRQPPGWRSRDIKTRSTSVGE